MNIKYTNAILLVGQKKAPKIFQTDSLATFIDYCHFNTFQDINVSITDTSIQIIVLMINQFS